MSQKRPRLLLLAAALVVAVVIVFRGCGDDAPTPPTPPPAQPPIAGAGGGGAFDPPDTLTGPASVNPDSTASLPDDMDARTERRPVGPALPDGQAVDVVVPYRKGAEAKFEIESTMLQADRATQRAIAKQDLYGVTLRVVEGDGTGPARVRLTIDWMGLKAIHPNGFEYEFDTRQPDADVLGHPDSGYEIQPQIGIVGIPIELTLDATGKPTSVDGADRWAEAWEVAVERLQPGGSRKMANPYADDRVLLMWSTWLFPPVGGGTMTTGEPRKIELLEDFVNAHYVSHQGPLIATHDDGDVFRVRFLTKAGLRPRTGASRSPAESAVAKVHVQGDADATYAAWRFDRKAGFLKDAEIEARYQLWTSYRIGSGDSPGAPAVIKNGRSSEYEALFLDISHRTRVERAPEPK